jgi:hypothetical protein
MTPREAIAAARDTRRDLLRGPGVRLAHVGRGTVVSFRGNSAIFEHPWMCDFDGSVATFLPGTVNKVVPVVPDGRGKDTPLDTDPAPALVVPQLVLDDEGRGFFCVEIECDPAKEWGIVKARMVQVANPDTLDGKQAKTVNAIGGAKPLGTDGRKARCAVTMLRRRADGGVDLYPLVHFHLTHRIHFGPDKLPQRHFFY